jgi:hypothetical protein
LNYKKLDFKNQRKSTKINFFLIQNKKEENKKEENKKEENKKEEETRKQLIVKKVFYIE